MKKGFTLIEIIVAVGLFAIVMTLSAGAYLMMLSFNRETQSLTTGINSLSFALDSMTRSIRTGRAYSCSDCNQGNSGLSRLSFTDEESNAVVYERSGEAIQQTVNGVPSTLTEPSVKVTGLHFYAFDLNQPPADWQQARVTIVVTGTVSRGPGNTPQSFMIETGATMRGSDL